MTTILCTLYNSLYLDKGLVLYDSLSNCAKDFKLYVLCMDDKCYEVLSDMNQTNHIPIRLSDFERGDEELQKAKGNRSKGEYCWTCSSSLIRYILREYKHEICTYIDADMYFYHDPQILVDEMLAAGKSVMITPHRFPKEIENRAEKLGTYCVEFNTFQNNSEGLEVLEYWRNRCLECCSNLGDGIHWGDQKYLEELEKKYECVYVCRNKGAGVAPWNIPLYTNDEYDSIVFYHFQSVEYIKRRKVNTNINTKKKDIDYALVDRLYKPYLTLIEEKKHLLETTYGINTLIKFHPTSKQESVIKRTIKKSFLYKLYFVYYLKGDIPYIVRI